MEVGLGVVEELLYADSGEVGGAEDLCVQGRAGGQGANEAEHGFADVGLACAGLGLGVDFGDLGSAGGGLGGCEVVEGLDEGFAGGVIRAVGVYSRGGGLGGGGKGGEGQDEEEGCAHGWIILGVRVGLVKSIYAAVDSIGGWWAECIVW